jgi:hypothetical protein
MKHEEESNKKMAYVFDPYYGYIPFVPKKEEDMKEAAMEEKKEMTSPKFAFHPYFGYIPASRYPWIFGTKFFKKNF